MIIQQKKCIVPECDSDSYAKTLCNIHYYRKQRTGDPNGLKGGHAPRPALIDKDRIRIPLGINAKNGYAVLDSEFIDLQDMKWTKSPDGYAWTRTKDGKNIRMHHMIIGKPEKPLVTDHINRVRLDNRKSNLRHVSVRQNAANLSVRRSSKSCSIGVSWDSRRKQWRASITRFGKFKHIGHYDKLQDAVYARSLYPMSNVVGVYETLYGATIPDSIAEDFA